MKLFKKNRNLKWGLIILFAAFVTSCEYDVTVCDMKTELRNNPNGVDVPSPRLSWKIETALKDVRQENYQIWVAKSLNDLQSKKNLVWDTGVINSDQSNFIYYKGKALESRQEYFWQVKVATNKGDSKLSEPASWRTAFLRDSDWKAIWIGLDTLTNEGEKLHDAIHTRLAARYLRKDFKLKNDVKSAQLYISGLGMYECYINGEKVSNDIFAPTATDYLKHVNYNCIDVTSLLQNNNAIGVILGNGRFFTPRNKLHARYGVPPSKHFGYPKLLMQLEVEYENGDVRTIVSDLKWKISASGPIVSNNEYDGEEYDSRLEFGNWTYYGFDDSHWMNAQKVDEPGGEIIAQRNPNMKTMREIKPIGISKKDNKYIIDMGQNMVGWLKVRLNGKKDQPIVMRFAETLNDDGTLYMANLRGAEVANTYIPKADGVFEWNPSFTYQGFRFVEISGIDVKPTPEDLTGQVNYDEMETFGEFETSDSIINQIYKNAVWGIMGNYRSFPTDCPQRDERMPWLGDRATGSYGESFIFDHTLLYEKWLQDIEDAQLETGALSDVAPNYWPFYSENITWPAAYLFMANMLYETRGDIQPIVRHYASMKKWLDHMASNYMVDNIITKDTYGDWCMPPESLELIHSKDPERITEGSLLATSFYYQLLNLMTQFANLQHKQQDEQYFKQKAEQVRKAFNAKYLNKEKGYYANNTVTANIISIMQGLTPKEFKDRVFENIINRVEIRDDAHVGVGLIGIQYLMRGLVQAGRGDLAVKLASNETYPSWGYMLNNGATTIWELWNGNTADPAMNSGNHVMLLGDFLIWCYENLAGIQTDRQAVGFKKIIMKPNFENGLSYVKAKTKTPYGIARSEWKKTDYAIEWMVEVPTNSKAVLYVPETSKDNISIDDLLITENELVKTIITENGYIKLNIGSGRYNVKIKL